PPPTSPLFPYTTLFRSSVPQSLLRDGLPVVPSPFAQAPTENGAEVVETLTVLQDRANLLIDGETAGPSSVRNTMQMPFDGPSKVDRKSTRLNSSHLVIS